MVASCARRHCDSRSVVWVSGVNSAVLMCLSDSEFQCPSLLLEHYSSWTAPMVGSYHSTAHEKQRTAADNDHALEILESGACRAYRSDRRRRHRRCEGFAAAVAQYGALPGYRDGLGQPDRQRGHDIHRERVPGTPGPAANSVER